MSERKTATAWHVYENALNVWKDGDLVAEIPSNQWQRLIMKLAEQCWKNEGNEAKNGKTKKADQ
jgi:hypothetical protein